MKTSVPHSAELEGAEIDDFGRENADSRDHERFSADFCLNDKLCIARPFAEIRSGRYFGPLCPSRGALCAKLTRAAKDYRA